MKKKTLFLLCTRSGKKSIENLFIKEDYINKVLFFILFLTISTASLINYLSMYYVKNFSNQNDYQFILQFIKISSAEFNQLLENQLNYSLTTILLSALIAYVIPHILSALIFIQLKSFSKENILYENVMHACKISLVFFYYFAIPLIGPYISFYVIAKTLFYLTKHYASDINNFFRVFIIFFSLYTTIFIINLARYAINEHLWHFIKS